MKTKIARIAPNTASPFERAKLIFEDPNLITRQDRDVEGEQRWQTIGYAQGILAVAHTAQETGAEEIIRIISARRATAGEKRLLKKKNLTEKGKKRVAIDTSDIPDLANTTGWTRGLMYRPVLQPISIRLPAPDIATAQKLARKKRIPYQTYIKRLLHDALERELGTASRS
jgi:uncharacterized DUF497 family protein/predicted DNA binding CopG/RHH family protein